MQDIVLYKHKLNFRITKYLSDDTYIFLDNHCQLKAPDCQKWHLLSLKRFCP